MKLYLVVVNLTIPTEEILQVEHILFLYLVLLVQARSVRQQPSYLSLIEFTRKRVWEKHLTTTEHSLKVKRMSPSCILHTITNNCQYYHSLPFRQNTHQRSTKVPTGAIVNPNVPQKHALAEFSILYVVQGVNVKVSALTLFENIQLN